MAKYNGVRNKGHIISKLVDLITHAEMVYACGITAAVKGYRTPSGIYAPAITYSNSGKLFEAEHTTADLRIIVDICGGILITMPSEADYLSPNTHDYMKKYLKGAVDVDSEDRIKALCLAADLCVTPWGAGFAVNEVVGAGTPEAQRRAIHNNYDFEKREAVAKRLANITS
jgi:aromatic ring hydroxylase